MALYSFVMITVMDHVAINVAITVIIMFSVTTAATYLSFLLFITTVLAGSSAILILRVSATVLFTLTQLGFSLS